MNTFIIDIDETVCIAKKKSDGCYDYPNAKPIPQVIHKIEKLYNQGNKIILFTARGYRTFNGDIEKIKEFHTPILEEWLKRNNVKYHQLVLGKPWGEKPIYVDNRNLSLKDFVNCDETYFEEIILNNCLI